MADDWLSTTEVAELFHRVADVPGANTLWRSPKHQQIRKLCRDGVLQEMGIAVEKRPGRYMIRRSDVLRKIRHASLLVAANCAHDLGMTLEERREEVDRLYDEEEGT